MKFTLEVTKMAVLSCNGIRIVPHDALFTHLYLGLTILIITKANCDLGSPLQVQTRDTANKTTEKTRLRPEIFYFHIRKNFSRLKVGLHHFLSSTGISCNHESNLPLSHSSFIPFDHSLCLLNRHLFHTWVIPPY